MIVNYPTYNKKTQKDFSDNFHNIKKSYKLTNLKKLRKTAPFYLFAAPRKLPMTRKKFQMAKIIAHRCQITV